MPVDWRGGTIADDTRPALEHRNSLGPSWRARARCTAKLAFYVSLSASVTGLFAQSCAAQAKPGANTDEIIITAQRRPERSQDVPISLTVKTGEDLDRMQVSNMAGLAKVVPSLVMTRTSVFTQPFLRGVGKRSNLGVENSVATYLDGVYLASPISARTRAASG